MTKAIELSQLGSNITVNGSNIGIGTDNPGTSLHISSADPRITITDTDASTRATQLRNTAGNTYLSNLTSGHIIFGAPTEMMRIQDNGRVGIGTLAPASDLDVSKTKDNDYTVVRVGNNSETGNVQSILQLKVGNANTKYVNLNVNYTGSYYHMSGAGITTVYNSFDTQIFRKTDGTEKLRFTSTGNVGIGTNNPARKLEIQTGTGIAGFKQSSSSLATTLEFLRNGAGTITNNAIEVSHSGGIASSLNYGGGAYFASNVGIGIGGNVGERLFVQGSPNTTFTNTPFLIKAYTDDDSAQNIGGGISLGGKWNGSAEQYADFGLISGIKENGTAGNYAGALTFATRPNGTGGGSHEKMRISSTGNVGINTTSPAAKLDIANSGNGASLLRFSTDRSWRFMQRNTGSSASLSLQAEVGNKYFNIENTNQEINLRMYAATDKTTGAFVVGEGLTRVPGIDLQNGYILVGTANYSSNQNKPILIAGTTGWNGTTTNWGTYGFQMRLKSNSGGTARLTIDDSNGESLCVEGGGNVGIGTDNPVAKLHIQGLSVQTAGAFSSNVTYGGRTFTANHDIRATSMRGGVLVRNMNDYRSETGAASFMHYDAYTTTAKSYAFRVARGATLSDTFWVKSDGSMYTTGTFSGASIGLTSNITQTSAAPQHIFKETGTTYGNTTWALVRDGDSFSIRWNNASPYVFRAAVSAAGSISSVFLRQNGLEVNASGTVVQGSLSKGSGSFRIQHPLDELSETTDLVHSFVEAPDASNLYAGMVDLVNGTATVNIDTAHRMTEGTFVALNHVQSWSSSNESGYAPVKCSISGNLLTIECQDTSSTDTVYYEVRGIRKDQHMIDTDWTDENGRVITEPPKRVVPE